MTQKAISPQAVARKTVTIKDLVGSGDKIMLPTAPVLVIGFILNILFPTWFSVGGPPAALKILSIILLIPGVILWLSSVFLVLTKVPQRKLITSGPYALMKHPLYTSVALLVLPWFGFLHNSWLGLLVGIVLYLASRRYAYLEEETLSKTFGSEWDAYTKKVVFPWL